MTRLQTYIIIGMMFIIILLMVFNISISFMAIVQWEYMIEPIDDEYFEKDLEDYGNDGWELIYARRALTGEKGNNKALYECIFKRPSVIRKIFYKKE